MTDRPSLGQLYHREFPDGERSREAAIAPLMEIPGSIGDQYSSWIAEDTATREHTRELRLRHAEGAEDHADSPRDAGRVEWRDDDWDDDDWEEMGEATLAHRVQDRPTSRLPLPPDGEPAHSPTQDAGPLEEDAAATTSRAAHRETSAPGSEGSERPSTSSGGLARASLLMASGTMVSRVLGVLRGILSASAIGVTTVGANVWSTANTIPNIIYLLLAGGVINAVLVPQITKSLRHEDGGKGYTDRLLTLSMTLLGVVTLVCVAGAPLLYRLYDFGATGDRFRLGTAFALLCLPQIFFYGVYALLGQVLNARGRFGAYMWSPALANIFAIGGLVYFLAAQPRRPGLDQWDSTMVWVLAGSATLGIVAQALVLIPVLIRSGYRFTPNFRWRGVGLRSASKVTLWAFAAVILQQVGLVVTTNVMNHQAESGGPGKQAQEFAQLLFVLPHSLITVSLVTALFTSMSKAANVHNHPLVRRDLRQGLRLIGVATIPCTVGAFVLGGPLIAFLYGTEYEWPVGSYMLMMMLGLTSYGLCLIVQRAFYAYEDAKTPFWMQVLCTGLSILITLLALAVDGQYVGIVIGLALTISNTVQGVVGLKWLQRRIGRILLRDIVQQYLRLLLAALVAGFAALAVQVVVDHFTLSRAGALAILLIGGPLFLALYVAGAKRLRVAEIQDLTRPFSRRLGRLARR